MKHYELTYIISGSIPEEEAKNLSKKIGDFITGETGNLEKTAEPLKKKFAYNIKGESSGFLASVYFTLTPEKIEVLGKKIKTENTILRHMILIKNPPQTRKIRYHAPEKARIAEESVKIKEPQKVELKELDKKIEEILGE